MEKKSSEIRKGNELILIFFVLCMIGVLGYAVFWMHMETERLDLNSTYNEKLITEREERIAVLSERKNSLLDEKKQIENYSESLTYYRNHFFELVSELENRILNGTSDKKIAYLTFDDGPYRMSYKFLNILDEYDVQATFFYLKKCAENGFRDEEIYDEVYRRVINSGHTLGNHTASHQLGQGGIYSSVERFIDEIEENRKFIYDRYGYTTEVMRFPGGTGTAGSKYYDIIEELRKINYAWVDWNSATGDGGRILSPQEYRDNVLDNTGGRKLLVVLMHDYSDNTLIALPEIIEGLAKQGYIFLPLFYGSQAVNR